MAKKKTTKKAANDQLSTEQRWGIGVGLTAAAVAAVGTYFLYGSKDAEKNRTKVRSWMLKAKAEVLEGLERAQQMSREEYEELVNTIGAAYADLQDASKKDIREFKAEMKAHWDTIEKYAKPPVKKARTATKKVAKRTKKTATSATKKVTKAAGKAKKAAKTTTKRAGKKAVKK